LTTKTVVVPDSSDNVETVFVDGRPSRRIVPLGPLAVAPRRRAAAPPQPGLSLHDMPQAAASLFHLVPAVLPTPPSAGPEQPTEAWTASRVAEPATPKASLLLMTIQEVAATLRCGRTCVYQLIGRGELPALKLGRLTRIPAAAVDAFVSRQLYEQAMIDPDVARWAASTPRRMGVVR
jgi:excisionase family DNA binding protein